MKYYEEEWKIDNYEDYIFRFKKVNTLDLLSLQMLQLNDEKSVDTNKALLTFAIENCEVKIKDVWCNVKEKGREIYCPKSIEDDGLALMKIFAEFSKKVIYPVFHKSSE